MTLELVPVDCGQFTGTERSAHQYLTGFGEKINAQLVLWAVTGGEFPVVVDVPTSKPEVVLERHGRTLVQQPEQRPRDALASLGIDPDEVGAVVLSHLHWDHSLGLDERPFPNATIYVQRAELAYAAVAYPPHEGLYDGQTLKQLLPASACEIPDVVVVEGDFELFPGLKVVHLPGHTPGVQGVIVDTARGKVAMGSDTVPFQSSWQGRTPRDWIPEGIHVSLDDCYRSMARLANEADLVLPSHDASVFDRPPTV